MMKIPDFATHDYLAETGPFRSLLEHPTGSEDPVFQDLLSRHQCDSANSLTACFITLHFLYPYAMLLK